jgi:pyruvate-formate lyase-activating enzyme
MDDLAYKQEVLGKLSPTFCGAKWYNATIWLGSGMTTSCHHPLPHKVDPVAVETNPKLLHNTPEKKEQRRQMQCGERPTGCEYCWKIEDMGPNFISDRVYKSKIYTDEELQDARNSPHDIDVNLRTLEIAFDRTCNFACSYCNPAFSTTWVKDLKTNGSYKGLVSDGRNHFTHVHSSSQLYGVEDRNPYVEAFFKWWDTDLHKTLRELRVTGGEPTMSADLWRLIDWFKANADKSQTKLAINSNLGGKGELIDRLIDARKYLPSLDVYTSCEAVGAPAEYIRDGLDWDYWWENICRLSEAGVGINCMMTVNALCLETLPDLIQQILQTRRLLGNNFAVFSLNILRFPSFQSALVLPQDIRDRHADKLEDLYKRWAPKFLNRSTPMHQFEQGQLERLVTYLRTVETPHSEAFEMPKLHNDFKKFYSQYDVRRNKNFTETFPELAEWYDNL